MTTLFRWFYVLAILCVSPSLSAEETDSELIAKIDASINRAVKFLASKQSPDGAWRSDVYAPFKEGDALTPLVMTALLPLPIDETTEPVCERGIKYLAELSKRTFEQEDGLKSLAYPVYAAANITIALHQNRRAEDEGIRARWVQTLRDLQLTEATGWKPDDVEFGGWTYAHSAAKKPAVGDFLGNLDQPNLSATAFALVALSTHGLPPQDPTMLHGLAFVRRLQNDDGGFFFIHGDNVRNKAGIDGSGIGDFRSYGSTTADGLRSLVASGTGQSGMARDARGWLLKHFSAETQPGDFAPDRQTSQLGLYFYWAASMADAFRRGDANRQNWPAKLAFAIMDRQQRNGHWQNSAVEQREDEPLVATPFAVIALYNLRMLVTVGSQATVVPDARGVITCHARDAMCHGEKLHFEPQPQKNTLGYWVNEQDYARWNAKIINPGKYEVIVWQGCGAGQGGSEVAIGVGDDQVRCTVEETGHFQHFKKRSVGRLTLAAGEQELTLKAIKKAKGAVADVRQISLIPVASAE